MSPPFSHVTSSLNPSFINYPLSSFLSSSGTAPTATGYALYQKQGNMIVLQFQYTIVTVGTGNYRLNVPVPISTTYTKPQGNFNVRYIATGAVFTGHFYESSTNTVSMVASTTYGGVPVSFTSASPNATLSAGDVVSGEIQYVIA